MSNKKEWDDEEKREAGGKNWELQHIRDELMDELDELSDEFKDEVDDLVDESEDIKEDLREDLEDLEEERIDLLNEIGDVKGGLEHLGADARAHINHAREKLEHLREKVHKHEDKFKEKIRKKLEKAEKKVAKRINISVDPEMSDEWRDWAEGLGASVSELVRRSMKFVKNNIGDIAKLEQWGHKLEKVGEEIERAVEESGIEDLGEKIEAKIAKKVKKPKIVMHVSKTEDTERIKKRLQGLIKLQKSIPIEKLAQALNIPNEEAENLIYELAAEGIEGELDGGVFKFTSPTEEVIAKLFELIDKM
jgi:predicted HicB family RNase H-like nuclease